MIFEYLRQLCLLKAGDLHWLNYSISFGERCFKRFEAQQHKVNETLEECSKELMANLSINLSEVSDWVQKSFNKDEFLELERNDLLENQRDLANKTGIFLEKISSIILTDGSHQVTFLKILYVYIYIYYLLFFGIHKKNILKSFKNS